MDGPAAAPDRSPRGGTVRYKSVVARYLPAALLAVSVMAVQPSASPATAAVISNSGDARRNGWYPDQTSLTPALVSSGTFGQLFSTPIVGQVYAQPLVVNDLVFVATEANWIYGIDAVNGAVRWSRNVGTPWNPQDVACGDLMPEVGITGTPAIDDQTGTAYFVAKTYTVGPGTAVRWRMHAVDVTTGIERAGFPVTIQGVADNNPAQPFTPVTQHQRPGLLLMDGVVYAAFGGHCDAPPFRGWVVGVSTAGQIRAMFSTRAGDAAASGNGIWHSGSGLVSDRAGSIVFATGNAFGNGSPSTPIPGSTPPPDLGQTVARVTVQPDGTLRATDFFTPFDALTLDAADVDLGAGGPVSLPPAYFGTPAHPNLILEIGKQGYLYVIDADNMGGSQQGPGGGDLLVNRLGPFGGVWGRPGVWPGDGGYVYIPYNQGSMGVYQYGLDGTGKPTFVQRGLSSDVFGYGSSAPVITSSGAASGSALVWLIWTPNGGGAGAQLRAYDPVPVNGTLVQRFAAPIGQATKFTPPGVGNNRVYVGTADGRLLGFGAPVNPPVTIPAIAFPTIAVGQSNTQTATITASASVTIQSIGRTGSAFAVGTPSRSLPTTLTAGQSITVPVSYTPTVTGPASGTLDVATSGGEVKAPLSGTALAPTGVLQSTPVLLSFGGTPVGGVITGTVQFSNGGGTPITIQGITLPATPFSASGLPPLGTVLAPGGTVLIDVTFAPTAIGQFVDDITLTSTGGSSQVELSGAAAAPGVLTISPLTNDFGTVAAGATRNQSVTVSNTGSSTLTITKSKPPSLGQFRALGGLNEGTAIQAGQSVTLQVAFTPPGVGAFSDTWVLNSDQPGSVLQTVTFTGTGQASNGTVVPPPVNGGWTLNGSASLLGTAPGSLLQLTPPEPVLAGSAFWPTPVPSTSLTVSFDTVIGGGAVGADGLTFLLADPSRGATPTSLGGAGGGLGAAGIPGTAVGVVTFPARYVGIAENDSNGSGMNWVTTNTDIPPLRDSVRNVQVTVVNGVMTVSVDGITKLTRSVVLPPQVLVGFTAGTGGYDDQHAVSNVNISTGSSPGVLSVTPAALDHGTVTTGQSNTRTVTISNVGGSALTLGSFTLPTAPFSMSSLPAPGATLAPGASVTATVTFAPASAGSFNGTLSIVSSAGTSNISLTGVGVLPAPGVLSVLPDPIDFGNVTSGTTAEQTIVISNSGVGSLTLGSAVALTAPFSAVGLPAAGTVLAAGQSVSATVRFSPSTPTPSAGTLTINSTVGSRTIPLSGTGVAPGPGVLAVSPPTIAFGQVAVGSSAARTVTVGNSGASPLTVNSFTVAAPFAVSGLSAGAVVAPGSSISATLTYTPVTAQGASGSLTINSTVGVGTVALSGTGVSTAVIPDPTGGGWVINGDASLLGTTPGSLLQLTSPQPQRAGTAFWPTPFSSQGLVAEFTTTIAGGATGADGMTLLLADPARGATPTSVGDAGGGLGATGIAGVAIGLVTFPTQYVGIADNSQTSSSMNWLATNGSIPTLRNATRRVRVTVANGTMTVAIDGTIALTRAVTLPPTVLLGFTAGTGGYFDQHAVSAVSITTGGSAATGILSMTPSTIAFGTVTTGTTASQPVTITNAGNAALAFSSFTLPGTPFSVTGLPAAGTSLAAGATVVATITYAPTAATSAAAAFTVTTNVGVATTSLTGTGKAAPAVSTVTPTSINFGSVTRGAVATRTVTVANTGGSPLTITSVGAVAAPYSLSGAPAANTVLQAGQSVTFTVRFSPTVKGIKRATIVIKTSAGRTNVALTGTGT